MNDYVVREVEFRAEIHGVTPLLMNNGIDLAYARTRRHTARQAP